MKIQNIQLKNYRNFENYSVNFGKETTIFIGKNGSGKTNLLSAVKHSLSFIFSKKQDEIQYNFIASSDQKVNSFAPTDPRYDYSRDIPDYSYPISIRTIAKEMGRNISWEFLKENGSSGLKDTLYRNANIQFWDNYIQDGTIKELPILAFFSDSYPHIKTNIGTNIQEKLNSGFPLAPNTAYYKWDEEKNCNGIWVQYFTMQWKNDKFQNGRGDEKYLSLVNNKIVEFSRTVSERTNSDDIKVKKLEIEARGKNDELIVVFEKGMRIPFNQLPQGYKRMFSIVFDIVNRAYILNSNAIPSGIVIIDELELHLHPSIAQEVLNGLKLTFPNIQFIVSSHSPLVITNFKQNANNIIYRLFEDNGEYKNEQLDDLYGIDYNSGLREWMETPYRNLRLEELKKAYDYWKNTGDKEKIAILRNKSKGEVGEDSGFYKSLG
ncbi:AAA family ATPase [Bacteroidales bacterium OttesenSCG-928-M06]|nr:AAA family ATPase [Bacteroidales bacterium OttesenSCG-928-M06]